MANEDDRIATEQIIDVIKACNARGEKTTASTIQARLGRPREDFRLIDRALQRARKKGAIQFDSKLGWRATGGKVSSASAAG
jgi:hypothetical protein